MQRQLPSKSTAKPTKQTNKKPSWYSLFAFCAPSWAEQSVRVFDSQTAKKMVCTILPPLEFRITSLDWSSSSPDGPQQTPYMIFIFKALQITYLYIIYTSKTWIILNNPQYISIPRCPQHGLVVNQASPLTIEVIIIICGCRTGPNAHIIRPVDDHTWAAPSSGIHVDGIELLPEPGLQMGWAPQREVMEVVIAQT